MGGTFYEMKSETSGEDERCRAEEGPLRTKGSREKEDCDAFRERVPGVCTDAEEGGGFAESPVHRSGFSDGGRGTGGRIWRGPAVRSGWCIAWKGNDTQSGEFLT